MSIGIAFLLTTFLSGNDKAVVRPTTLFNTHGVRGVHITKLDTGLALIFASLNTQSCQYPYRAPE